MPTTAGKGLNHTSARVGTWTRWVVVITAAIAAAGCSAGAPQPAATSAPSAASPAPPATAAPPTGSGRPGGRVVVTAFHVISEVTCSGPQASVPASWATIDAQTVSFEVDGQPLGAAAGYPTSGTGDIRVPCDGRDHQVLLVAAGTGGQASRSEQVDTRNNVPPPGAPTVTAFQVLDDLTCPGTGPVPVAASWTTSNATTVSFAVDGQPLSAAAGYPTSGSGNVPVPCDGRPHRVTLTAAAAGGAQATASRSVDTTPVGPTVPITGTTTGSGS